AHLADEFVAVDAELGAILQRVRVVHLLELRPVDRRDAERARLARRVDIVSGKIGCAELLRGVADRDDLAVPGGIEGLYAVVATLGDDLAAPRDDGRERAIAPRTHLVATDLDCARHDFRGGHCHLAAVGFRASSNARSLPTAGRA